MNVLDIAQNSIVAGAQLIEIAVLQDTQAGTLQITVTDDGCGMTEQQVENVVSPFFTTRTTRKVGLGVPLFKMAAEMAGGTFDIRSSPGGGTRVRAVFGLTHIDRAPLGDMNSTVSLLIRCNPAIDFLYRYAADGAEFTLDTRQLRETLGEVPLNTPDVMNWIDEFLKENTQHLHTRQSGGANT